MSKRYDYLYLLWTQVNHLTILSLGFYWQLRRPSPSLSQVSYFDRPVQTTDRHAGYGVQRGQVEDLELPQHFQCMTHAWWLQTILTSHWEQRRGQISPLGVWGCPICSWKEKSILEPILTWPRANILTSEVLPNMWGHPGQLHTVPPSLLNFTPSTHTHKIPSISEIHQSHAYLDLVTLAALRKNSPSLPAPQVVPFCLTSQSWRRMILVLMVLPP